VATSKSEALNALHEMLANRDEDNARQQRQLLLGPTVGEYLVSMAMRNSPLAAMKIPHGRQRNSPDMAILSPQIWPRNSPDMAMKIPHGRPRNSPVWLGQRHHPLSRDGICKTHRLSLGENEMGMVH